MIVIGLAIGPLFHVVDPTLFEGYASLIATITLILVLFDTGLTLNIFDTTKSFGTAFVFTLLVLVFSTLLIGAFFAFILGWNLLHALLMGIVSSGSTTIVSASLLPRLKMPTKIQQILFLESVINDVTLITAALVLLQIIDLGTLNVHEVATALVYPLSIAVVAGLLFSVLWVNILWKFYRGTDLAYVFTIGLLFILFPIVELMGGNGAIAVFVLALSLGNLPFVLGRVFEESDSIDTRIISHYQERFSEIVKRIKESEITFTFLIQNFFFVYLGVIFDVEHANYLLIGTCVVILTLMFISRYVSARVLSIFKPEVKPHVTLMASMVARGFTSTFVALLPSTKGIDVPLFKEIVLAMVLFSTIVTMVGSIIYELKPHRGARTMDRNPQIE